jgi:2-polyprenyl-3-methyl-5-hydroxy-6-metoxy-1,4-benzoquinol methylase
MVTGGSKEIFLNAKDDLGTLINNKANELFFSLKSFNTSTLDTADTYNDYFIHHHLGHRLFFSIQNSAHILYDAVKLSGKNLSEINAIDYGAGLGTLFMLGGMLGFNRFDYNDHLPEWQATAKAVCRQAGISINNYITGDINAVTSFAASKNIQYDIVVSRNVIEHIYSLPEFYSVIFRHNPKAVIYSTTTANYHNPVMRLYHIYIHKKVEKQYYKQQRINEIKKLHPSLSADKLAGLTELTRGKGQQDFIDTVNKFINDKTIFPDNSLRSNTCDCITGVWIEHLLTRKEHTEIAKKAGFKIDYTAGYWDTHYSSKAMNILAVLFNKIIYSIRKNNSIFLSPFVNIVAYN